MTEISVEAGIKLPPKPKAPGRKTIYPFKTMKVRESFLFPEGTPSATAYAAGAYWTRKTDREFTVRKTEEGFRCWRVS